MDEEKAQAYTELAARMEELHESVALLVQNVDRMARADEQVTAMTKIFHGVFKNAAAMQQGQQQEAAAAAKVSRGV